MQPLEIVRRAEEAGVQLVSFHYCDNGGIIRGKTTHVSGLRSRLDYGMGLTVAMQAMTDMDELLPFPGMGPVGEVRLIPDPDTFTLLPYAPKRALMLADLITGKGEPWGACPRSFLKRMLAKAESHGITFQAAMEPEWYLMVKDGDRFVPSDQSLDNTTIGATHARDVIDDIVDTLLEQGLGIEQYYPEVGHGQQELSIGHDDALRAADNHIIYRETVRNVAFNHGMFVSFAPKPFPEHAGTGNHIHLSAWDESGEQNLFYDADGEYAISKLANHFIAGVMTHLPGLIALSCPSMNSYRRLSPGSWSTAYVCYGPDNREAALRIPSTFWGSEMATTNLEYRPSDSSANPYIALGGVIAAGMDGIERELTPDPNLCIDVDPASMSDEERERRGIKRYPETLQAAIDALDSDPYLKQQMGDELAESYLAVRRSNWEIFSANDTEFELRHHIYKY